MVPKCLIGLLGLTALTLALPTSAAALDLERRALLGITAAPVPPGAGGPACGSLAGSAGDIADTRPAGLCPSLRGGALGVSTRCWAASPRERARRAAAFLARTVSTGHSSRSALPETSGSPFAGMAKPTMNAAGAARIRRAGFIASWDRQDNT